MRPRFTVLGETELDRIIDGAFSILEKTGMHVGSPEALDMVGSQNGARIDGDRVLMSRDLVEKCVKSTPSGFNCFDQSRDEPVVLAGDEVNFVVGSATPYIYDEKTMGLRQPVAQDLFDQIAVVNRCQHIDFYSGGLVVRDVPRPTTTAYRYYLALSYCPKPMFSGAIRNDDMLAIKDMLAVLAGGEKEIEKRPYALMGLNPSSPLGLTELVAKNIIICAEYMIPGMLIPIPLAGGSSPVTLAGTLVQHTAENLGALVLSQCARPGVPLLFGGGPSIMDMRKGTACQASTEAVVMGAAIGQIAKRLDLPSATNTGRADSKRVDYQAGEETGIGLTLMALAGINLIRGSGTLEYANVLSTEKMLIDNEICGMAKRMLRPMETDDGALALDVISERGTSAEGYLSAAHTIKWFRSQSFIPSDLIDRGTRREFEEKGSKDIHQRAVDRMHAILAEERPSPLDPDKKKELDGIMTAFARKYGMEALPIM